MFSYLAVIATIISDIAVVGGVVIAFSRKITKISNGTKCQLRSEMLRIYYHNVESQKIRQYEYENFCALYEAYKALKGNSFINRIYEEVSSWEITT